jgi:hypothetical protein
MKASNLFFRHLFISDRYEKLRCCDETMFLANVVAFFAPQAAAGGKRMAVKLSFDFFS